MMTSRIAVGQSATVAMNSRVAQMRMEGKRVYNLSAGEPVMPLHSVVFDELCERLKNTPVSYAPAAGLRELREQAAQWMNKTYATMYSSDSILITPGGKFGIYAWARTYLGPGDEALVIAPYWVSYVDIPYMVGASLFVLKTSEESGWKISVDDIDRACTQKTKALFLNNACNPTGTLYSREEIAVILECAARNDLIVISDEVYSGLVYDGREFVSCASFPEYRDRVVVVQSVSKHFAMTGWRVGWLCAPSAMIADMLPLQTNSVTCASTASQWATISALRHADVVGRAVRDTLQYRRDVFCRLLSECAGKEVALPPSALYCFIHLSLFGTETASSEQWCLDVLERAGIASVPGSAFGCEGYVRFAFGECEEELRGACDALQHIL